MAMIKTDFKKKRIKVSTDSKRSIAKKELKILNKLAKKYKSVCTFDTNSNEFIIECKKKENILYIVDEITEYLFDET